MATYLSILRGINVSGQKIIKMDALKALYESIGFKNITTYIQSGNLVFESKPLKKMDEYIKHKIADEFGFEVPIIILKKEEIQSIVESNPFLKEKNIELDKLHITFLAEMPTKENLSKIAEYNYTPDVFIIKNKAVYLHCPKGYGNTKLNNTFFENKLKVTATTRNWKTSNELLKILNSYK
jgi:uncharacterized protein (DUF1697 family)